MGQDVTFARSWNGHNSVIFHLILTLDHTKINSFLRQIEVSGLFCSKNGRMDQHLPKNFGICPGHHLQLKSRNLVFEIFRGEYRKLNDAECSLF